MLPHQCSEAEVCASNWRVVKGDEGGGERKTYVIWFHATNFFRKTELLPFPRVRHCLQQQRAFTACAGGGLVSTQRAVKWPDESSHMVAARRAPISCCDQTAQMAGHRILPVEQTHTVHTNDSFPGRSLHETRRNEASSPPPLTTTTSFRRCY